MREHLNTGFAEMFKNGVIMDVTNPEQARLAEAAGACAVMALERVPSDIRATGGVARMSDPGMIRAIMEAVIHWQDPARLAALSEGLGEPMRGLEIKSLETAMAARGI